MDEQTTPLEALETVNAAIADAVEETQEQADETIAAVIEAAEERIDEAQETAEKIAEAAMQTEIGRRISALEERIEEWTRNLSSLEGILSRIATLESQLNLMASLSSTPQASTEDQPEVLQVEVVETQTLQSDAEESPDQQTEAPAKPRKTWI